jgi:hypothetical protein
VNRFTRPILPGYVLVKYGEVHVFEHVSGSLVLDPSATGPLIEVPAAEFDVIYNALHETKMRKVNGQFGKV